MIYSLPENIARSFNSTLSYFRNSHDSPILKRKTLLKKPDTAPEEEKGIDQHLLEEIDKFNKLKLQKQVLNEKNILTKYF